jgi:hypothetical protein
VKITFTICLLWLAEIPGVHWVLILFALGADLIHAGLKGAIGWKGEWR